METKLSLAVANALVERLIDRKELELEVHQEKMSYNLIDCNGNDGYRVTVDLNSKASSTSPLDRHESKRETGTIVVYNYEIPDSPVYLTQKHFDIPVLDATGANYLYAKDLSQVSQCTQALPEQSIILSMQSETNGEVQDYLDENYIVGSIDWQEATPGLDGSQGLFLLLSDLVKDRELSADEALDEIGKILFQAGEKISLSMKGKKEASFIPKESDGIHTETSDTKSLSISESEPKEEYKELLLDSLVIDRSYQARAQEDESAKSDLETAYRNNETIPPITVVRTPEDSSLVVDGFHRVEGARRAGLNSIPCKVISGTKEDAFRLALGANEENKAVKRSDTDKRKAVNMALDSDLFADYSNRKIADICKVSPGLVDRVVKERKEAALRQENPMSDNRNISVKDNVGDPTKSPLPQQVGYHNETSLGADASHTANSNMEPSRQQKKNKANDSLENEIFKLTIAWQQTVGNNMRNSILVDLQDVIDTYGIEAS